MAGVALALVAAASCSGDNKGATPTTTVAIAPAPATTAAPPAATPKFSFGFVAPSAPLLLDLAFAQENALVVGRGRHQRRRWRAGRAGEGHHHG